jgi:capsular exopolysaccharide synthesis family protein
MSRLLDALQQSKRETGVDSLPQTDDFLERDSTVAEVVEHPTGPAHGMRAVPADAYRTEAGVPAVVSLSALMPESRVEALTTPNSFAAEQFRTLGARLHHLAERRNLKTILVTSDSFQEGKTLICLNLAVTLAKRSGRKVLLIEADLRKPALMSTLGVQSLPGMSDWVRSDERLTNFIYQVGNLNLWTLPAGNQCEHPLEIVQSARMRELVEEGRDQFDWVLIDSAPLLVADANVLSRLADGTLIVVRQTHTRRKRLQQSMKGIENALGFVLNDASAADPSGYDHYYYSPVKVNGNGNGRHRSRTKFEPHREPEIPPSAEAS